MYYKDGRFRKDIFYLLYVVNYYEKERLLNVVSIYMRMRKSIGLLIVLDVNNILSNFDLLYVYEIYERYSCLLEK